MATQFDYKILLDLKDKPAALIAGELSRLNDENKRLRVALQQCRTEAGALGVLEPKKFAVQRFAAINATADAALGV